MYFLRKNIVTHFRQNFIKSIALISNYIFSILKYSDFLENIQLSGGRNVPFKILFMSYIKHLYYTPFFTTLYYYIIVLFFQLKEHEVSKHIPETCPSQFSNKSQIV